MIQNQMHMCYLFPQNLQGGSILILEENYSADFKIIVVKTRFLVQKSTRTSTFRTDKVIFVDNEKKTSTCYKVLEADEHKVGRENIRRLLDRGRETWKLKATRAVVAAATNSA
jgi:hypothetical protein